MAGNFAAMGALWDQVLVTLRALPWLLPCLPLALGAGWFVSRVAGQAGRPSHAAAAFLITASTTIIAVATLAPPLDGYHFGDRVGPCLMGNWEPTWAFWRPSSASLNVLLFIPLGAGVALARRPTFWLVPGLALSIAVEGCQHFLPFTLRSCDSQDIADNWFGLLVGFALAAAASRLPSLRGR
jgi:hypothetical protein